MFEWVNGLETPHDIFSLIFECFIVLCGTVYMIYRLRANKKNGGSWRQELKEIKKNLNNHIQESQNKYKEIQDEMQHIKKHTDKCCKGHK